MAKLQILDSTGHSTLEWTRDDAAAIANAEAAFNEALAASWAFAVDDETGTVTQLPAFDPAAEHIVMAVPLVGG